MEEEPKRNIVLDSVLIFQNNTCARMVWPNLAIISQKPIVRGTEDGMMAAPDDSNVASDGFLLKRREKTAGGPDGHPQN